MDITIVIASYKYGHLAAHCIESVLSQSVKPTKILFIDDGVGDCTHLPALYPSVEFILREENLGTVANFQDALMRVDTKYCMFLGADNWISSDTIQLLATCNTDIIMYDIIVTGELKENILTWHSKEVVGFNGDYYWNRRWKHHGSMAYNTLMAKSIGYVRNKDSVRTEEDLVLFNALIKMGATVSHIPKGLLYYRRHKENFNK